MNRKVLAATLAVAAATVTGCHHAAPHHAHKASAPAPGSAAAAGSVQQARAELDSIPTRPKTKQSGYAHTKWARHDGCDTRGSFLQSHAVQHSAHIKAGTR